MIMKIGCVATKEGSQVGWGGRFMWLLKIGLCVCDKDRRAPNLSRGRRLSGLNPTLLPSVLWESISGLNPPSV